ncbi:TPA: hypothetical protein ACH3X3_006311 [Trebouxia sp. C0006]
MRTELELRDNKIHYSRENQRKESHIAQNLRSQLSKAKSDLDQHVLKLTQEGAVVRQQEVKLQQQLVDLQSRFVEEQRKAIWLEGQLMKASSKREVLGEQMAGLQCSLKSAQEHKQEAQAHVERLMVELEANRPDGPKIAGSPADQSSPVKDRSPVTQTQPELLHSQAGLQAPHVQAQPQAQQQQSSGFEKQSMKAGGDQEGRQATGPQANDSRLVEWEADRSAGHPLAGSSERRPTDERHSTLQQPQPDFQAPHMPAQPQAHQQQICGFGKQSKEAGAEWEGRQATNPQANDSRLMVEQQANRSAGHPLAAIIERRPAKQRHSSLQQTQADLHAPHIQAQIQAEGKQRENTGGSVVPSSSHSGSAIPPVASADERTADESQAHLQRPQPGLQAQPQAQQQQQSSGLAEQSVEAGAAQEDRQALGPQANDSRLVEWEAIRSAGHTLAAIIERRPTEERHSTLQQPQPGLPAPHMQAQPQVEEKQGNDTIGSSVSSSSHAGAAILEVASADERMPAETSHPNLQRPQAGLQAPLVQAQPQAQQQQSSGLEKQSVEAGADQEAKQVTGPEASDSRKAEECTEARCGPATSQPASQDMPTVLPNPEGQQLELSASQLQLAAVSSLGWAPCLLPQATLLQNRLRSSRGVKAVAAVFLLAAVAAQQSHQPSQTEIVGPPAPTLPLNPPLMCPVHVLASFLGRAPCLPLQSRLLLMRLTGSRGLTPVAAVSPLAAVAAQQFHQPSQTETVGPPALTPPPRHPL